MYQKIIDSDLELELLEWLRLWDRRIWIEGPRAIIRWLGDSLKPDMLQVHVTMHYRNYILRGHWVDKTSNDNAGIFVEALRGRKKDYAWIHLYPTPIVTHRVHLATSNISTILPTPHQISPKKQSIKDKIKKAENVLGHQAFSDPYIYIYEEQKMTHPAQLRSCNTGEVVKPAGYLGYQSYQRSTGIVAI